MNGLVEAAFSVRRLALCPQAQADRNDVVAWPGGYSPAPLFEDRRSQDYGAQFSTSSSADDRAAGAISAARRRQRRRTACRRSACTELGGRVVAGPAFRGTAATLR